MNELKLLFTDIRFLLVFGNILYLAIHTRLQSIPSFRDLLRCIPASLINFGVYYIAPTLARLSGPWIYRMWSGEPPDWTTSFLEPVNTLRYYRDETTFIDYWYGAGLTVFMTIGFKLSYCLVECGENLVVNLATRGRLSIFEEKKAKRAKTDKKSGASLSALAPDSRATSAQEVDPNSDEPSDASAALPAAPASASATGSRQRPK